MTQQTETRVNTGVELTPARRLHKGAGSGYQLLQTIIAPFQFHRRFEKY